MFDTVFTSVLADTSSTAATLTGSAFMLCTLTSLAMGLAIAGIYMFRHRYSKNFVVTLALLPLIVQVVIALVNGNLGAGIAVMGVFNLVRFRSIPGTAKDIAAVFLAMAVGLATGMGYLTLAIALTAVIAVANIILVLSPLGEDKGSAEKSLKVTIPEDLDYSGVFDDLFEEYTTSSELINVKTTNMGSLFQLEYLIRLKELSKEKEFIDEIRCRNGNLAIQCGRPALEKSTL